MSSILLDINNYTLFNKIGNSSFSELYTVKEKNTGDIFTAKISLKTYDQSSPQIHKIQNDLNQIKQFGHASILQYLGYSPIDFHKENKPIIISQYMQFKSLDEIINKNITPNYWNDTKKLINIYGIASAMSCLHSHEIIHGCLYPTNILMDYHMFPKISDFQSLNLHDLSQNTINPQTAIYTAPELCGNSNHSKEGDVYAFGMIVYQILTNERPFTNLNFVEILTKVSSGKRPEIPLTFNKSYKKLIEKCWSHDPENRPSFDEITEYLRLNKLFITESIDENEYKNYINYIDEYQKVYEKSQECISYEDFAASRMRIFGAAPFDLNQRKQDDQLEKNEENCEPLDLLKQSENKQMKSNNFNENDDLFASLNKNKKDEQMKSNKDNENDDLFASLNKNKKDEQMKLNKDNENDDLFASLNKNKKDEQMKSNKDNENDDLFASLNKNKKDEQVESNKDDDDELLASLNKEKPSYSFKPPSQSKPAYISEPKSQSPPQEAPKQMNPKKQVELFGENAESQAETTDLLEHAGTNDETEETEDVEIPKSPYQGTQIDYPESYQNNQMDLLGSNDSEMMKQSHSFNTETITFQPISPLDCINQYAIVHKKIKVDTDLLSFLKLYEGNDSNKKESMRYLRKSLESGSTLAMNTYGAMLYRGECILKDKKEAARYFKMAFENGDLDGMYNYACVLFNGDGVKMNKREAIGYLQELAIEKEHIYGMSKYGTLLLKGNGVPIDTERALYFYKTAADRGCPEAMYNYGFYLNEGTIISKNQPEAYHYYKMAADHGLIKAFTFVGYCLLKGIGVPQNKQVALDYLKAAIDNDNPQAMVLYASIIEENFKNLYYKNRDNFPRIVREYVWHIKRAADLNYVRAMTIYANLLVKGEYLPKNYQEAIWYYKMAADKGTDNEMLKYATILMSGEIAQVNQREAAKYFKMAADEGNVTAMHEYATMLRSGNGIESDKNEAAKYFKMAAEKGSVQSMNYYGSMSLNGEIECDKKEAVQFLIEAANTGLGEAIYNLGMAYYRGHGVEPNKEEAIILFKKAADKGVKEAIDTLKSLGIKTESSCTIF